MNKKKLKIIIEEPDEWEDEPEPGERKAIKRYKDAHDPKQAKLTFPAKQMEKRE